MPQLHHNKFKSFYWYLKYRLAQIKISEVFVYGTGLHAQGLTAFLQDENIRVIGFIDDGLGQNHQNVFESISIFRTEDVETQPKTIIIASWDYQEVIYKRLSERKMPETQIFKVFEQVSIQPDVRVPSFIRIAKIHNRIRSILYVGDNTDTPNFGCRATSQALYQLLSKAVTVSDKISRNEILALFEAIPIGEDLLQYFAAVKKYNDRIFDEIKLRINQVDAIVLNGEGSFIFQSPPRLDMLNYAVIMLACIEVGRPFYILNAMFTPFANELFNHKLMEACLPILKAAQVVAVRDPHSAELLAQYHEKINIQYVPDALFSWFTFYEENKQVLRGILKNPQWVLPFSELGGYGCDIDFEKSYILMSGNSYAAHYPTQAYRSFMQLAEILRDSARQRNMQFFLIECCAGDRILRDIGMQMKIPVIPIETNIRLAGYILGNAACFVSGRYHPSILASLGGTPCVFMGSNSHKTASLQEVLEIPENKQIVFNALPDAEESKRIVTFAETAIDTSDRDAIRNICRKKELLTLQVIAFLK